MVLDYWTYGVADVALKRNVNDWTRPTDILPPLNVFGEIDRVLNLPVISKLQQRSKDSRYIGIESAKHVRMQLKNGTVENVSESYFHPCIRMLTPYSSMWNNLQPSRTHWPMCQLQYTQVCQQQSRCGKPSNTLSDNYRY